MSCRYCGKPVSSYNGVLLNQDGDFVHKECEKPYREKMNREMDFICSASDKEFNSWMMGGFEV